MLFSVSGKQISRGSWWRGEEGPISAKSSQNCPITRKRQKFVCLCRQCSNDDCDVFLRALLRHFSLLLSFSDVEDSIDVDKLSTEKEVTVDGAADKNIENLNAKDETESNEEDRESSIQQQQLEEERQSNQDLSDEDEKETDKEEEELKIEYDSLERITPIEMGDNHRSSTEDSTDRLDFFFFYCGIGSFISFVGLFVSKNIKCIVLYYYFVVVLFSLRDGKAFDPLESLMLPRGKLREILNPQKDTKRIR